MKFNYVPLREDGFGPTRFHMGFRFEQTSVWGMFPEEPNTTRELPGEYVPMDDYLEQQGVQREQSGVEQVVFGDQLGDQGGLEENLGGPCEEQEPLDRDQEMLSEYQQYLNDFFEPNIP